MNHFAKSQNRKFFGFSTARILNRYYMAKATIERKSHFRKKRTKTEVYSKFFNLVAKNRKFKKGKIVVLRGKNS